MRRLGRIKVGDEVKFTESYLDFWFNEAYDLCSRAGEMKSEEDAQDYLARKILWLGYPYKAIVVRLAEGTATDPATNESLPGYKVKVILRYGLVFESTVSIENVALFRRKKRRSS